MNGELVKPKIGQKIYIIYRNSEIYLEEVFMLGDNAFIHQNCLSNKYVDEYRKAILYCEYGIRWFTTLAKAKEFLLNLHPLDKSKYVVKKYDSYDGGFWRLEKV